VTRRLYVEGGGDSKALRRTCARGFRKFLERAGIEGRLPRIVACGSRDNTYKRFSTAHHAEDEAPVLLVDAEAPVTAPATEARPWEHLKARDGWARPHGASDDQCHLMVQEMESWFLADRATLTSFFGQHFQKTALPGDQHVEQIGKTRVIDALTRATRNTQKGRYDKGSHSFEILARLDPGSVESVAPYAKRFLDTLRGGGPA